MVAAETFYGFFISHSDLHGLAQIQGNRKKLTPGCAGGRALWGLPLFLAEELLGGAGAVGVGGDFQVEAVVGTGAGLAGEVVVGD